MDSIQEEAIEEIMSCFDFEKVKKTMDFLRWGWGTSNGKLEIPSLPKIKESAKELLIKTANEPMSDQTISRGGFVVRKDDDYYFSLSFVLADWDNWGNSDVEDKLLDKEAKEKFSSPLVGLDI